MKSTYWKKLFVSYLLILAPTFLLFTICTANLFAMQERAMESAAYNELTQLRSQFELQMQAFELQSLYFSLKPEMQAERVLQNRYDAIKALDRLADVRAANAMLEDVVMWYGGDDVYASVGMSRASTYAAARLLLREEDKALFLAALRDTSAKRLIALRTSAGERWLMYHAPISIVGSARMASANYILRAASLSSLLGNLSGGYERALAFCFQDGEDVWLFEEEGAYVAGAGAALDAGFLRMSAQSQALGTRIDMYLRADLLFASIERSRRAIFLFIAGALFAALWVAFALSERNSRPIRQLAVAFDRAQQEGGNGPCGDEIDVIRRMMDITLTENAAMRKTVDAARGKHRQQTLVMLFHGLITDRQVLGQMLEVSGGELYERCFAVALVVAGAAAPASWFHRLSRHPDCELSCLVDIQDTPALAVLVSLPTQDGGRQHREEFGRRVETFARDTGYPQPVICLSRAYEDVEQAYQAYIEAMFVYRANVRGARMGAICFDEIVSLSLPAQRFDMRQARALQGAVGAKNFKAIERALHALLSQIEETSASDEARLSGHYQLMQLILHSVIGVETELDVYKEIERIDPADAEELPKRIIALFKRLCADQDAQSDAIFEAVCDDLAARYKDQNLTLDDVAARVGRSKAYISRLFRAKRDLKYIDYLTELRMNEAKRLLRGSDLRIREIVTRVGYWDAVSFQKKFKALYGVNPSEYRSFGGLEAEEEKDG